MMNHNVYIFILVAGIVSTFIRVLPMTLFRKPIENQFIRSFLYYVPYVTLAVMTFPAIITATQSVISGWIALAIGIVTSYKGLSMFKVAVICCVAVYICELVII